MRHSRLTRLSVPALTAIFAALTLGPLLVLTYVGLTRSSDAVEQEATARVSSTAAVAADFVHSELDGLATLVDSYARRPSLIAALEADPSPARRRLIAFHLRQLKELGEGVSLTFVAGPSGLLLDIVPPTPSIVGDDFSFRDWYRGAVSTRRPYVSEAYVTAATGNARVVAAATLVRGGTPERTLGVLVAGYDLEHIQAFAERFAAKHGVRLTVTDQRGVLVAAPGAAPKTLISVADDPRVRAALGGGSGVATHSGPDGADVAAYAPVPGRGWAVTASVPRTVAFAPVDRLRTRFLTIAGLLALVLLAGIGLLAVTLRRRAEAEAGEREARRAVQLQNEELEAARDELELQNAELEAQASSLEDAQEQLTQANAELSGRRDELEQALNRVAEEKERIEAFYALARTLVAETDAERLAPIVLERIADFAEAELGALHLAEDDGGAYVLAATRGIGADGTGSLLRPGEGLPGRALAERASLQASHGEGGLRVPGLGGDVTVQRELHVPLLHAGSTLGVLTLARLSDREFSPDELETIEHLARQAAVAFANAATLREALRLGAINHAVLDAAVDGITMVDTEGRPILRNAAMERILAEIGLQTSEGYRLIDAASYTTDPERFATFVRNLLADPEREDFAEFDLDGVGRVVQLQSGPVRSANGELLGRIVAAHDVTRERQAERLKSELVATVSHELRTPLTGILGFAELLAGMEVDAETQRAYLQTIVGEAYRLRALVNDFLDLQRIEEGTMTLALEPVPLEPLLREQVALHGAQAKDHTIELEAEEGLVALGERDRIAQVLANLLSNAIKYSPEGGTVGVSARAADSSLRVEIRDQGLGIPHDQQRRVFEKFFRVDSSDTRRIGGTGLGLALTREIVEAHGGRIGFESEEGEGSTFWFELPRAAGLEAPVSARPRVLVVEDDPGTAELLRSYLEEDGHEVEVVATGTEALRRAEHNPPAVICLDVGLPGRIDGWEVLTRLKGSHRTAGVPVVVCTGSDTERRALALGASDFLAKPFSRQRLIETVVRLVAARGSVLVVDDDEAMRNLVIETLTREGLDTRPAADGHEALELVAEQPPDLIVLDLSMPGLDGFDVLERLRGDPDTRKIPVVVLTARELSELDRARLRERAGAILQKTSYSAHELRRLVRQAIAA